MTGETIMMYEQMSEREKRNAEESYYAATQGMVLLKNTGGVLPLDGPRTLALFGLGASRTVRGGTGSGDVFNGGLGSGGNVDLSPRYNINVLDAFVKAGFDVPTAQLLREYGEKSDAAKLAREMNLMETFAYPEKELTEEMLSVYAAKTETAIYVLSRNAGEGADRRMTKTVRVDGLQVEVGDYLLCAREIENLRLLKAAFKQTVVVLNVGGPIDVTPLLDADIDAILLMGQAGQEGGRAVVDVLCGAVNPSGKLTDTWAASYLDYPASATFGMNDGDAALEKYEEGIFVGYRYFDSFGIEPIFEFGYGLSYTEFDINSGNTILDGETILMKISVKNIGRCAGREVVQVYFSAPESELPMPSQELIAFGKTDEIPAGGRQELQISFNVRELASFDEARSAYILSGGDYLISIGSSSRETKPAFRLRVPETVVTQQVLSEYSLKDELHEIDKNGSACKIAVPASIFTIELPEGAIQTIDCRSPYSDETVVTLTTDTSYTPVKPYERVRLVEKRDLRLSDVLDGSAGIDELIAQMSASELAELCCGSGWGIEDESNPIIGGGSQSVPGAAGETTRTLFEKYGIPSMIVADGPAGVRVTQEFTVTDAATGEKRTGYNYCTAWPVGTLLAQSFDEHLLEQVGAGIGEELSELGISIILGPGMNIHRDPLCGRNFEYYSEDPRLTGKMAAAITRGTQNIAGVGTCLKHFIANNQETNRNGVDTWISQRTLREIYLKGFEIATREAQPMSIMTSYNLVNRVETAQSYDLCTDIARGEWGFKGLIMTDWNGGISAAWKCLHAGNDLIMPGGAVRIRDLEIALHPRKPEFDERGQVVMFRENPIFPTFNAKWNSFIPSSDGNDWITAEIADGHKAELKDEAILVDGEPLFTVARSFNDLLVDGPEFKPFDAPACIGNARLSDDGKSVSYRGTMHTEPLICLGDLQSSAEKILRVVMNSVAMRHRYPGHKLQCWSEGN